MFPKFNNIDNNELVRLSKKFNIEWKVVSKNNRNSIILFGKNVNNIFCLKQVPLGNQDFKNMRNEGPGTKENIAWMELHILETLEKKHKSLNSQNFIHLYTKFVKLINDKPYLCLLFQNIPFTLYDMIHLYPYQIKDTISFLIQLFFVAKYMNDEHILHNDLHYFNIMVDIPLQPTDLKFFDKSTNTWYVLPKQDKIYYVIDYGVAEINYSVSNFYEWKKFFTYFQSRLPFPFVVSKMTSFTEMFQQILRLNHLKKL